MEKNFGLELKKMVYSGWRQGMRKFIKYPIGDGALENSITIITGKGEQVWIGTKKGLCSINSGTNKINWYSINQGGLPHNFINCLYIDRTGQTMGKHSQ